MQTARLVASAMALAVAGAQTGHAAQGSAAHDRTYALPDEPVSADMPGPSQIDPNHSYALYELIDIAETANPLARGAWDESKDAALAVGLVRSAYLPRLTAIAAGIAETSHDNQRLDGAPVDGNGNGRTVIAALSLQWLLFDFGQRRALERGAQLLLTASNIHLDAVHQKIIRDVSASFYTAAAAHDETVNAQVALDDALKVQNAAEQRRAQGQATVVEIAQVRQASAQARVLSVMAAGHEADARITLLTAMGVSPLAPIRLASIPERPLAVQDGIDAHEVVTRALGRRPDIQAALALEGSADENVNAARADFRPKVFFASSASYQTGHLSIAAVPGSGVDGSNNLSGSSGNLLGAVGVSIPLYDGGMRSTKLAQARARADEARAQFDAVRITAVHDIVLARTTLDTSLALYAASTELLGAAQTSFDAALGAYSHGAGTVTEVNAAEIALMSARNGHSAAYSGALSAAASLALATGDLATTPGVASGS